ncbi:MAG: hypothetical protein NVSMB46_00660 [Candidatus Saccharimonadales bacterium]
MENVRQQIVERIKQSMNVLVTVSSDPSVDQLAAAIGFTLLLNKMGKHGTAVFSGTVPSTLEFLQPENTIEKTTDSLRDFIIALDKSKADKLRYKVEDEHVKIFITPYRTSISDKDLEFSQGDFNVDVVIMLGVIDQKDLDQAIVTHGRILHDATVVAINTATAPAGELASINWVDNSASSLCEMVSGLCEVLEPHSLDAQMATALLTGIVAETDRFSNVKTSATTMTVSAALMAAGANQQLVATKLQEPVVPIEESIIPAIENTELTSVNDDVADPVDALPEPFISNEPEQEVDNSLSQLEAVLRATEPHDEVDLSNEDVADAATVVTEVKDDPEAEISEAPKEELIETVPEIPESHIEESENNNGALRVSHDEEKSSDVPQENTESNNAKSTELVIDQIHIDDQGKMQVKGLEEPETIEPKTPKFVLEPPILGGTLTANSQPERMDPANDALGIKEQAPLLSHDVSPQETEEDPIDLPEPLPTEEEKNMTSYGQVELETSPLAAEGQDSTVQNAPDAPMEYNVGSARDAVQDAINTTQSTILEPISALNATPIDLNLDNHAPIISEQPPAGPQGLQSTDVPHAVVMNPTAPPPVPPPMMPPIAPPEYGNGSNDPASNNPFSLPPAH